MNKLKETLTSRKFLAYISTVSSILAADTEPGLFVMSALTIKALVAASIGYMTAQGIADAGKEKAKIENGLI